MRKSLLALAASMSLLPVPSLAADYTIDIQNLTRGVYFTPLVVAAHPADYAIFTVGAPSSLALQTMAEGGNIAPLVEALTAHGSSIVANPAEGLLMPGASTTAVLNNDDAPGNTHLSIAGMLLPTNDGFVGLSALPLPTAPGVYHYLLNAYDAGTEANDEVRGSGAPGMPGMPVPPPLEDAVGTMGSGVDAHIEGFVHIHRGVLGDFDKAGGISDVDATVQRWLNPIARLVVTVE